MTHTSAGALRKVLQQISNKYKPKERFRSALADYLGLEGDEGEMHAVVHIYNLTVRVRDDIERSGFETPKRQTLKGYLAAFNGILSLSHLTKEIQELKSGGFLKPEQLKNLEHIDMALDGKVDWHEDEEEAKKIASSVVEVRAAVAKSTLPEDLKKTIDKRLRQLQSALEHFRFYGLEGLQEALSLLIGDIALQTTQEQAKDNPELFEKIIHDVKRASGFASSLRRLAKDSLAMANDIPKLIENIGDFF